MATLKFTCFLIAGTMFC